MANGFPKLAKRKSYAFPWAYPISARLRRPSRSRPNSSEDRRGGEAAWAYKARRQSIASPLGENALSLGEKDFSD